MSIEHQKVRSISQSITEIHKFLHQMFPVHSKSNEHFPLSLSNFANYHPGISWYFNNTNFKGLTQNWQTIDYLAIDSLPEGHIFKKVMNK